MVLMVCGGLSAKLVVVPSRDGALGVIGLSGMASLKKGLYSYPNNLKMS